MKISIPKDYDIRYIDNNKCLLFISSLLFLSACGLRLNVFPFINYIFYFLALFVLIYSVILTKKIKISVPIILSIVTSIYFWITQVHVPNYEFLQVFTKATTITYFIIASMLLAKLSKSQVFYICNIMLFVNLLFHTLDLFYRIILLKFNVVRLLTDIYSSKNLTFIHLDTNFTASLTLILIFLSYYLYTITKSKKYIFYSLGFSVLTFFSMSRSAWIAIVITCACLIFYKVLVYLIKKFSSICTKINRIPLKYLLLFIILILFICIVFQIFVFIKNSLLADPSFKTKLDIYNYTLNFLYFAPNHDLLFGTGFNHGKIYVGSLSHTHTFATTFLIESGLYGLALMLVFYLSVFLKAPKTIILFIPFLAASFSFSYLSPLFYSSLAIVCYFEECLNPRKYFNLLKQ